MACLLDPAKWQDQEDKVAFTVLLRALVGGALPPLACETRQNTRMQALSKPPACLHLPPHGHVYILLGDNVNLCCAALLGSAADVPHLERQGALEVGVERVEQAVRQVRQAPAAALQECLPLWA